MTSPESNLKETKRSLKSTKELGMVAHTFDPSSQEAEVGRCCEFKTSLVYMVRSRPARTAQWEPVSEQQSAERVWNCVRKFSTARIYQREGDFRVTVAVWGCEEIDQSLQTFKGDIWIVLSVNCRCDFKVPTVAPWWSSVIDLALTV